MGQIGKISFEGKNLQEVGQEFMTLKKTLDPRGQSAQTLGELCTCKLPKIFFPETAWPFKAKFYSRGLKEH